MVRLKSIHVNYLDNPIGVEALEQVGWVIESDEKNILQTHYQIQLSESKEYQNVIYDTGEVASGESSHVKLHGLQLKSSSKYFIRARVKTNCGVTEWQEATFVTALLSHKEWQAKFITIESEKEKEEAKGSYLRRKIEIKQKVKTAYVYTTALGLYQLYMNGNKISEDEFTPGWTSYHKHLLYQMYDVTAYISTGANVLGAMLGAGWYKGTMGFLRKKNNYGELAAFACQLEITYEDGSKDLIVTDEQWKGMFSPILFSEIYDGEIYDARMEIEGWNQVSCQKGQWEKVSIVEQNTSILRAQCGAKVKRVTKLFVERIIKTPNGDTVLDFGQNMTGWIQFRVKGYEGATVTLNCFEVLDADGNVYLDNLRSAKATITYICKDDKEAEYCPHFSFQGFRYALVAAYPGEIQAEDFIAYAIHSDMKETGSFECSNEEVNQLQHNILWSMKGNFLDIPTDCPQRDERLGWTGDAQIFCRTASYLMDTYTFFRKWLRDVSADQTREGGVPHVVPDILAGNAENDWLLCQGTHSAAAWADVAVILPWTLYLTYGDITVLEEQYGSMKGWIDFMAVHAQNNIWNYQLQFGDWVALDAKEGSYFGATPNELTCTAYYAYSTGLFAKMADILQKEEAVKYHELYDSIVKTYQETFFDECGHLTAQTQTAQIVSLYFELVPERYKENIVSDLLKLLEQENGHLVTGFVGTPYFCHALSRNGCLKEAFDLLLKDDFPSWLYQVKMGATTIWEHWDGLKPDKTMWSPDMNSFNHYAYGAIGEWLYRVVAGIEIDETEPGYKHSIIAPHIGGDFQFAHAEYKSLYGNIRSGWRKENNEITLEIEIPCNTTATIRIENSKRLIKTDGIDFKQDENLLLGEIGSGSYQVKYVGGM